MVSLGRPSAGRWQRRVSHILFQEVCINKWCQAVLDFIAWHSSSAGRCPRFLKCEPLWSTEMSRVSPPGFWLYFKCHVSKCGQYKSSLLSPNKTSPCHVQNCITCNPVDLCGAFSGILGDISTPEV